MFSSLDCLTISRSNVSEPIPVDLIMEILLRSPVKSTARCRCVSKRWASILSGSYFTELFLTKSSASPQLLFVCKGNRELLFFKSPQPQNLAQNSIRMAASYHTKIPFHKPARYLWFNISSVTNGLMMFRYIIQFGEGFVFVLCNPSTGQLLTLPKPKTRLSNSKGIKNYLGYDPIEKLFKVLSTKFMFDESMFDESKPVAMEHQVLTLGTGELSWRRIECCVPHHTMSTSQMCISLNGVLYYPAASYSDGYIIVCFDVRLENFRFITCWENESVVRGTLINYNGKLGSFPPGAGPHFDANGSYSIELWVLEDAEKQEWSKHRFALPSLWRDVVGSTRLSIVGITRTGDIVLVPDIYKHVTPFYVFFFNVKKNTITRIEIQGLEAFHIEDVLPFLDHVENVMQGF